MSGTIHGKLTPLREEHKGIMRQLSLVRASIRDSSPAADRLRGLVDGLGSRLEIHFVDEERILYKPLKLALGEDSPTSEMMREHETIQLSFERLRSGLEEFEVDESRIGELRLCLRSLQER